MATEVTAIPNENYHFVSWNDGKTTATRIDSDITANIEVSATFEINKYEVSFESNGGHEVIPSINADYGTTITLPSGPTKTEYTFAGWNTNANGSGTGYSSGSSFTIPGENITLYAQWEINKYEVTFERNGGNEAIPSINDDYGTTITLPSGPTKTGYTFTGVNTKTDGSGTGYSSGSSFTIPGENVTLYAQWRIIPSGDGDGDSSYTPPTDSINISPYGGIFKKDGATINIPANAHPSSF